MKQTILLILLITAISFYSCEKVVEDTKTNPFVTDTTGTNQPDTINPYSIRGLHKNIFAVRCANPTCHDGSFEPDFRTVQSTYSSLVYQPVIKNNPTGDFAYRVIPYNENESWLFERLVTGDPVLGRMPLYSVPLSNQELLWITGWIGSGAPDINGVVAKFPNLPPIVKYYYATNASNVRIDTIRANGWSSPFVAPSSGTFSLFFRVEDDSTNSANLIINQLKISTVADDFTNAIVVNATYISNNIWVAVLSLGQFISNTQYYFRYYVNDPEHTTGSEYPSSDSPFYFKENASFIIQ